MQSIAHLRILSSRSPLRHLALPIQAFHFMLGPHGLGSGGGTCGPAAGPGLGVRFGSKKSLTVDHLPHISTYLLLQCRGVASRVVVVSPVHPSDGGWVAYERT